MRNKPTYNKERLPAWCEPYMPQLANKQSEVEIKERDVVTVGRLGKEVELTITGFCEYEPTLIHAEGVMTIKGKPTPALVTVDSASELVFIARGEPLKAVEGALSSSRTDIGHLRLEDGRVRYLLCTNYYDGEYEWSAIALAPNEVDFELYADQECRQEVKA